MPPRPGDAAHAPHGVKSRHHRAGAHALHLRAVDVHRHVDRAQRRAEDEERGAQRHQRLREHQHRQERHEPDPAREHHAPRPAARADVARHRHGDDGADPEAQQQEAELRVVRLDPRLGEGDERRPGGHDEACREEGQARGEGGGAGPVRGEGGHEGLSGPGARVGRSAIPAQLTPEAPRRQAPSSRSGAPPPGAPGGSVHSASGRQVPALRSAERPHRNPAGFGGAIAAAAIPDSGFDTKSNLHREVRRVTGEAPSPCGRTRAPRTGLAEPGDPWPNSGSTRSDAAWTSQGSPPSR
jgi:hypothetical protein